MIDKNKEIRDAFTKWREKKGYIIEKWGLKRKDVKKRMKRNGS